MKALILAAGLGTRLLPLTRDCPKPLLPIAGRPLLDWLIGLLVAHGIREIAINLHHQADAIVQHLGRGEAFGADLVYSREDHLLGTAGAAKRLQAFLREPFFVLYGDVLTDVNLAHLAWRHHRHRAALSMLLYRVEDPGRAGIADVDPTGRVLRFCEKPTASEITSDLANTGVLVVEPDVLASVPDNTFCDFGQHLVPWLVERDTRVYGWLADGYVLDIGSPERYRQAEADAQAGRVRLYQCAGVGRASVGRRE